MITIDAPALSPPDHMVDKDRHYDLEWELGEGHIAYLSTWFHRRNGVAYFDVTLSQLHRVREGGMIRTTFGFGRGMRLMTIPCPTTRFSRKQLHAAVATAHAELNRRFAAGDDAVRARFAPDDTLAV